MWLNSSKCAEIDCNNNLLQTPESRTFKDKSGTNIIINTEAADIKLILLNGFEQENSSGNEINRKKRTTDEPDDNIQHLCVIPVRQEVSLESVDFVNLNTLGKIKFNN